MNIIKDEKNDFDDDPYIANAFKKFKERVGKDGFKEAILEANKNTSPDLRKAKEQFYK